MSSSPPTANALLLGFRDAAVLNDILDAHDVVRGEEWRMYDNLRRHRYFTSGSYRLLAGHYLPGEMALYVRGEEDPTEEAVTLLHEMLHAYCDDEMLTAHVSHEEIEVEAQLLATTRQDIVESLRSHLGW